MVLDSNDYTMFSSSEEIFSNIDNSTGNDEDFFTSLINESLGDWYTSNQSLTSIEMADNATNKSTDIYNDRINATFINPPFVQFLEEFSSYAHLYYTPLLTITGIIGNIISVLVFCRTRLRKLSSSYYLSALCISDTGFLLINFVHWLTGLNVTNIFNKNGFCQVFALLEYFFPALSVWFVVTFTLERFIAVMYPLKRQTICTVKRAKSVLIILVLIGVLHSLPMLMLSEPRMDPGSNMVLCIMRRGYEKYLTIYTLYDAIISFMVPLTAIVLLNFVTAYTLWELADVRRNIMTPKRKYSKQTKQHTQRHRQSDLDAGNEINTDYAFMLPPIRATMARATTKMSSTRRTSNDLMTHSCQNNGRNSVGSGAGNVNGMSNNRRKQTCVKSNRQALSTSLQMKVTKMLLFVSTVFVLLNLPSYVLRIIVFVKPESHNSPYYAAGQHAVQQFFNTNFGINFVLYCMSGQNFRKETINMFRRRSYRKNEAVAGTQVTILELLPSSNGPNRIRTTVLSPNPNAITATVGTITDGIATTTPCCETYELRTISPTKGDII